MAEVVTRGTGEHEQLADRAVVRVSFAARGADRAAAVAALGSRVEPVEAVLAGDGVEVRSRRVDVHTAWERTRRVGCTAQLSVVLRLTRVDVVEGLLQSLVTAEPESLSGPHWELTDDSGAVAVAQQRAVADARRRAEGYAAALGARLGPLQRLSEPEQPHYGGVALAARSAEPGGVVELGLEPTPVTVTVTCTTVWTLLD
ncbi:MAG: SIMPL domain-containing protein [Pseudonocardiaceae bacterium]